MTLVIELYYNALFQTTLLYAISIPPRGRRGFKSRIRPPYPQRVVKGVLRGAVI